MKFGQFYYPDDCTKPVLIYGVGELARLAFEYFTHDSPYTISGFIAEPEFINPGSLFMGLPILSANEIGASILPETNDIFVAFSGRELSYPRSRKVTLLKSRGFKLPTYVSGFAFIAPDAIVGSNVMIFEHNTIQSEVVINDSAILWSGNHIGHQTSLGEGVFVSSHVCIGGRSKIANNCYFGMNSTVRDQVTIGENTVVGANSYVHKDFEGNAVLFGVPAKKLPSSDPMKAIN